MRQEQCDREMRYRSFERTKRDLVTALNSKTQGSVISVKDLRKDLKKALVLIGSISRFVKDGLNVRESLRSL